MIQQFCNWLLVKRMKWTIEDQLPLPEKCIICLAPHTSNLDFIMGVLYMFSRGIRINFLMKKEWFRWPLGPIFRSIGGIPVFRAKHSHMTDALADAAIKNPTFRLCITPEGTRSLNAEWKKGFYFIAQKARIPILLYSLDYDKKLIRCADSFIPQGDIDADMVRVKHYFIHVQGKHPEKFTTGLSEEKS